MIKSAIILFLFCFLVYLPFSRIPDYFDSETTQASVVQLKTPKGSKVVAIFTEYGKTYIINIDSATYASQLGKKIELIYEESHPQKAVVNKIVGYWLKPMELFWSFGIFAGLLIIAYATTHQPQSSEVVNSLNSTTKPKNK